MSCLATPIPLQQDEVMGELITSLLEDDWSKAYEQPPQDNRWGDDLNNQLTSMLLGSGML